nr:uncharacterized protein LOC108178083 [Oryctolagus cuniculus]
MTPLAVVPVSVGRAGRCCHRAPLDVTAARAPPPGVGRGEGAARSERVPQAPAAARLGREGRRRGRRRWARDACEPELASGARSPARPPCRGARVGASMARVPLGGLGRGRRGGDPRVCPEEATRPPLSLLPAAPPHCTGSWRPTRGFQRKGKIASFTYSQTDSRISLESRINTGLLTKIKP